MAVIRNADTRDSQNNDHLDRNNMTPIRRKCWNSKCFKLLVIWAIAIFLVGGLSIKCVIEIIHNGLNATAIIFGVVAIVSALLLVGVVSVLDICA